MRTPVRSLYIHVPFCFHKCHYCDFYSFVDTQDRQTEFVDRLLDELSVLARAARLGRGERPPLRSVFVGGGTPSLLRVDLWRRLLAALRAGFDLSPIDRAGGEFTVECNPETVTPELMATLAGGGVNRVSVGAQSFQPAHLKTLERWHDPANVGRALELAAQAGIARRSIDLIFAIPGQSLADWDRDLDEALALRPAVEHLSAYALTYEPNTAMTRRLQRGEFVRAADDLEADMYERAVERLAGAGLRRYEVSNFAASPAAQSLHNLAYWRCESWLAAGPSASGHVAVGAAGGHRWKNVPRLSDWSAGVASSGGYAPIVDHEPPDPRRALAERLMMGIRLSEGVDGAGALAAASPLGASTRLADAVRRQVDFGLLTTHDDRWRLTDRGFLQCDGVAAALMAAL